jgi:uncharacterized membrane protein YbhN (UPF0104 family)
VVTAPRDSDVAAPRVSWRRTVLGLTVGVAIAVLAMSLLGISRAQVVAALERARPLPLALVACGSFGLLGFQALRWWLVMRPVLHVRYRDAFTVLTVAFLFNNAIPGRGGDLLRVHSLGRQSGTSRATLLGTELLDILCDKWGWLAAFLMVCLLETPPRWLLHALAILGGVVVCGSLLAAFLGTSGWLRGDGRPDWIRNLQAAFAAQRSRRVALIGVAVAPLPWLWETLLIVTGASTLGLSLSIMQAFAALTAFNVAIAVPSVPGNMGTFEAGGAVALIQFGFGRADALAAMLLYHLALILPPMALGVVMLTVNGGIANLARKQAPTRWGLSREAPR